MRDSGTAPAPSGSARHGGAGAAALQRFFALERFAAIAGVLRPGLRGAPAPASPVEHVRRCTHARPGCRAAAHPGASRPCAAVHPAQRGDLRQSGQTRWRCGSMTALRHQCAVSGECLKYMPGSIVSGCAAGGASFAQQSSGVSATVRVGIVSQEAKRFTKKKAKHCEQCLALSFGSPTWARTRDLRINSPSLYRLSYRGIKKKIISNRDRLVKLFSAFSL